jgi:hypothetical protein
MFPCTFHPTSASHLMSAKLALATRTEGPPKYWGLAIFLPLRRWHPVSYSANSLKCEGSA